MDLFGGLQRLYGQFDKNVAQGYLPGGAERQKNATELLISSAVNSPPALISRSGLQLAGKLLPETVGPIADSGENAIRAISGDSRSVDPSSYSLGGRNQMADAIDNALADSGRNVGEYVDVQYEDYGKGESGLKNPGAYLTGAMMARKNADGTYEIAPNEVYDFNAASNAGNLEYKANLDAATKDAFDRGDIPALIANLPDHLAYHTGAGGKGFKVGGTFSRGNMSGPEVPSAVVTNIPTPTNAYAVQAGDTLSSIAANRGTTLDELIRRNNIANPDLIQIGQMIR
tara:strand:- start:102 stop:959 length:858 start_codon:yes stop_codon:yes gene_type:complete